MLEPVLESLLLWLVLIDTQVISLLSLFPFDVQFSLVSIIRVWMLSLENLSHFMFSFIKFIWKEYPRARFLFQFPQFSPTILKTDLAYFKILKMSKHFFHYF